MWILMRALVYATLFIGLLLVFLPARLLSLAGVTLNQAIGVPQVVAIILAGFGGALVLWGILTFVFVGKGTQAPFDPPRLLVRGPYRFVRNPIYVGAGFALGGAALYYRSFALLIYLGVLALIIHLVVLLYEEPTLRRSFPQEYEAYCAKIGRWWPKL